ncbi:hypothetical protein CFOL_v3_06493 [Cephalotus follicularis]|uniref:Uncharacterized protein n=1 Tax=Cephalotus follicularis TaxID=3775 RepID=A0A1Q3B4L5_CEPFO|nr:hypothetical protein CFOL_v3_06493 [Cephalotus follicularis]
METLSRVGLLTTSTISPCPIFNPITFLKRLQPNKPLIVSVLKTSSPPGNEIAGEDILQSFFQDRQLNGDFISKASDILWQREITQFINAASGKLADTQQAEEVMRYDNDNGFLKLTTTHEWILGDNSAPINKKASAKELRKDGERRKKLNLLQYEALKRELMLLSVSIGAACSGYCLIALSIQAAISYAVGVVFSCLYLQLLYRHSDSLSKEMVPEIFLQKKTKKIGIRIEDLKSSFERTVKGSGIALSSPRLVIPAAIYGLWVLSHQYIGNNLFDFQLVPAMFGMFVYKAAALVQVYRDNEDLQLIFPENGGGLGD